MATLINVGGATRSGTTMLDLMLGNTPDAFSCGEVYAWFRPWKQHHHRLECRCGQNPCPIWEKIKNVPENQFHMAVVEKLEVSFVIDSSKELCWLIDTQEWASANRFKVFKLLLWKNPINLAYSHWKRGHSLTGWYHEFVSYYSKFFETGLPFRSVYFNDLVSNPQRKLEEICSAVGIPYFYGKERFWEKQHHHLFGSHGTYLQVKQGVSTVRARETFPPDFEKHVDALSEKMAQDPRLQQILETLQRAEISSRGGFSAKEDPGLVAPKPYPLWYYARKVRQVFRSYFPDRTGWVK
jgi:hypothetical protein